jgi:hypothetical protein
MQLKEEARKNLNANKTSPIADDRSKIEYAVDAWFYPERHGRIVSPAATIADGRLISTRDACCSRTP